MKAVLLRGPGEVILDEIPVPEISDDEVLVEVKYAGICGSDLHAIPEAILMPPGTYLGHEFSGVLAKVGKNVKGWRVGDRVTANPMYMCGECYACKHGNQIQCPQAMERVIGCASGLEFAGAFAKFVRVPIPESRLYRLPDSVSFEEGALVEPLSCSLHAVRISNFRVGDDTMVLGAGMIGLGTIAHLRAAGAGIIVATETLESRAQMAKRMGANYVFNPVEEPNLKDKVLELTNGKGMDIVYDCSGVPQAFRTATDFLRKGGQILLLGIITRETPILPMNFNISEWELKGSLCYNTDEFPMVLRLVEKGDLPYRELVTSKIKLSNIIKDGFEVLARPGNKEIKILVEPDE